MLVITQIFIVSLMLAAACSSAAGEDDNANLRKTNKHTPKTHALGIVGFNYTNRYIGQFYMDGQGGDNLAVSTPTSGGGGVICCMSWTDGTPLPAIVHLRWVSANCLATVTNSFGNTRQVGSDTFSEIDVQLTGPVPQDPRYVEAHFFPDGHIELAITTAVSSPRLKLPESRQMPRSQQYPPCKVP